MNSQTPTKPSNRPSSVKNKGGRPRKPQDECRKCIVKVAFDRENYANIMQVLGPAERIADVITDLAVQPDVVPAMGGGGGSTSDLKWNDDDKERRRPQTTDYVPTRKPRR